MAVRRATTPPRPKGVQRLQPKLPPHRRVTYAAETGPGHFTPASCEEVDCSRWRNGFAVLTDQNTELGQRQAHHLRRVAGRTRTWREEIRGSGIVAFVYPPGTDCFADHQRRVERPPLYVVRRGDWRAPNLGERRVHRNVDEWVEDMQERTDKLSRAQR